MGCIEEYKGMRMAIPQTGEEALMKMEAEMEVYKKRFRERDFNVMMSGVLPILYEYDRKKAIEFGVNVSEFPEELNYLEIQN